MPISHTQESNVPKLYIVIKIVVMVMDLYYIKCSINLKFTQILHLENKKGKLISFEFVQINPYVEHVKKHT